MPPNYTPQAQVVDIRIDAPRATDRFFVDTNVWAWAHYPSSRYTPAGAAVPQAFEYSDYLNRARAASAIRYRAPWCLVELTSVVEHTEWQAFRAGVQKLELKDYRHNEPNEHDRIAVELIRVWNLVEADGVLLPLEIDDVINRALLRRFRTSKADGYDLLAVEAMLANGVTQIISDDGDLCSVAGIVLFTANPRVIAAARAQGLLITR